jgi:hypothetical protein
MRNSDIQRMPPAPGPIARAHHFNPQCWLSGFTDTGEKSGKLWVTDLKRRKQWPSNPLNAGHRRDFYRVSDPQVDPLYFEKRFSEIEDAIAPTLKRLDKERRAPGVEELDNLLSFAAVMFARVPAFRPFILGLEDSIQRSYFSEALQSPKSWVAALRRAGVPIDAPGASYEQAQQFEGGGYYLSAENEWYLYEGFRMVQHIIPILRARHWTTQISPSGSYIAADNPVAMDGPPEQKIGFESAELVFFPVSRHVLLCGTSAPVKPIAVNRWRIAAHNTFTMLTAEEHVYSHAPDFCWLDEAGKYQTDWKLFGKESILRSFSTGGDTPPCRLFFRSN